MRKIYLIILLIVVSSLLCACGDVVIKCNINENDLSTMSIAVSIDTSHLSESEEEELQHTISDLKTHLDSEGYKTQHSTPHQKINLKISKSSQGTSSEDAMNKLLEMMGDTSSPFSKVEGGYDSANLSDAYQITATVDLTKIVDYDYISTLKQDQQDRITELMSTFTGTVTLDLYGNTTEFKGELDGTANTVKLSLNEPTEIYSMVEIVNEENQKDYDDLKGEVADLDAQKTMYLTYVFIAAGVLLLMAIAIIMIMITRKNKKSSPATNKEIAEPKAVVTQETETGEAPQDTQDKEDDAGK